MSDLNAQCAKCGTMNTAFDNECRECRSQMGSVGLYPDVKCPCCGKVIDPDWCHCGEAMTSTAVHDNHHPIPVGCDCFRTGSDNDYTPATLLTDYPRNDREQP